MYKLPFNGKNEIRAMRKTEQRRRNMMAAVPGADARDDSDRIIEFAIPGLMEPETVNIRLEYVNDKLSAVIRGEIYNQDTDRKGVWRIDHTSVVPFEEVVEVPIGATASAPKATLTVAKDNCGNIDGGVLRLEWQTVISEVPVEVKDCAPED